MMGKEKLVVAMLCAEYPPKSGPGPTRMAAFTKGLAARAFDPVVFTTQRVPDKFAEQWYKLDGIADGGDKLAGSLSGRGRRQSWLERVVNFFVPMEPRWTLSLLNLQQIFRRFVEEETPDLIFTTSNPLASAVGGMLLKSKFKIPLIVEFRDPWLQNPIRIWPTYIHFLLESWLERRVLRTADAVIMNTPTARLNLLSKYGWLDENKVHVISHGFDGEGVESAEIGLESVSKPSSSCLTIAYAGGFYLASSVEEEGPCGVVQLMVDKLKSGIAYNIKGRSELVDASTPETILRAVAEYNADKAEHMPRVEMHFIGTKEEQVRAYVAALGVEADVFIHPRIASAEVRQALHRYDFLFLTNPDLSDSPFVGTKTFDYLGARRSIIAELNDGDQAQIISTAEAGWVVPPGSHQAIVDILRKVADESVERNAPDLNYISLFERKHQIEDLARVIEQVMGSRPKYSVISQGYREILGNEQGERA